ncbi:hypothetical protein Tco_1181199 [Tanacetum coccineum]
MDGINEVNVQNKMADSPEKSSSKVDDQLTHPVSCKAEDISPLMNILQSRVSLTEEQLTKVHQRLEFS